MIADERFHLDRRLLEAAALEAGERSAYLERLAGSEPAAAAEIGRRLARAAAASEAFLRPPDTGLRLAAAEDRCDQPPTGNSRYRIEACLGEGGMARVYRAFDRELDRPVALKVLDGGGARGTEAVQRRVLQEARSQARIRHDHVLDVYETGLLDDRPYIAVRYVAGGTLAELSDAVAAGMSPSLEQRVRLVAQAAEGLHAAHRQGLLHGDVKPSNILLEETPDGELRAWIGDFGIATELRRDDGENETGELLGGTPRYMAPELLRKGPRSADRRSDVYSLGMTLHQVLTGELPGRPAGRLADLRERYPDLPVDLLAVVARCLAVTPSARYPSARAVAEDLRRFLNGEAVGAYADRLVYRWSRFAARNRKWMAVTGGVAVLLLAALLVAAAAGIHALRAQALVEDRRQQAEGLIGFMLTDLRDKLDAAGRLELLDDVGKEAMVYFAAVPEDELSDRELARRSTALHQIGDVRMRRGDLTGAEEPLRESLALARELSARNPDHDERLFDLGQSEYWVGYAAWRRRELGAAHHHFAAYHRISRELTRRAPHHDTWRRELAYAESNLGSVLHEQGRLAEALEHFQAALALDRRLVVDADTAEEGRLARRSLASSHNTVGVVLEEMGRLDEAQAHYERDLELRSAAINLPGEAGAAGGSTGPAWDGRQLSLQGVAHQYLGALLLARGAGVEARRHLESARSVFAEISASAPDNGEWRALVIRNLLWLGEAELSAGRPAAAEERWRRAENLAEELIDDRAAPVDWRELWSLSRLRRWTVAPGTAGGELRAEARRLSGLLASRPVGRHRDRYPRRWLAEAYLALGDEAARRGQPEAARRYWRSALGELSPVEAGEARDHAVLIPLAACLERLGRAEEAWRVVEILRAIGARSMPHDPISARSARDGERDAG